VACVEGIDGLVIGVVESLLVEVEPHGRTLRAGGRRRRTPLCARRFARKRESTGSHAGHQPTPRNLTLGWIVVSHVVLPCRLAGCRERCSKSITRDGRNQFAPSRCMHLFGGASHIVEVDGYWPRGVRHTTCAGGRPPRRRRPKP